MTSEQTTKFKEILTDNGYRITNPRLDVFSLLLNSEPLSMNELVKKSDKKLDRVTIYRTIELFENLGIVNRLIHGWKYKLELSDMFIAHHHHMVCLKCGLTVDVEDEKHIDEFINEVAKRENFVPIRHTFEIDGYCNNCAMSKNAVASKKTTSTS